MSAGFFPSYGRNRIGNLKRPSRQPPPPPLPSKPFGLSSSSLAQTRTSFNYYSGGDSEYSELSVQSVPHVSNQRSYRPSADSSNYNSAQSESGLYYLGSMSPRLNQFQSASRTSSQCPESCCSYSHNQQSRESVTKIPRERIFRPKISISPAPINKNDRSDRPRPRYRCNSLNYRRHVEQHIGKVFKYLRDRQGRLNECELSISAGNLRPQEVFSIRKMLSDKETKHLRSLRAPLSSENFKTIKELGAGFMGTVWLVEKKDSGDSFSSNLPLFAMKKLSKSQVFKGNHMAYVMAERDILAEADNQWIVKLYYSFQDIEHLYFILEYIPGGDMMHLLCKKDIFSEEWARFYIAEISLALQFVHDMNYIHRDLKPDNILIDARGHLKLTDFGLCRGNRWTHDMKYYRDDTFSSINQQVDSNDCDEHPTITTALTKREIEHSLRKRALSVVGSPHYIAPEVLRQADQNPMFHANEKLCDWWSVGVILYEMVVGFCPFIDVEQLLTKGRSYDATVDSPINIQQRILNWRKHLLIPPFPRHYPYSNNEMRCISNEARSLIAGWLCEAPQRLCQSGIIDIQNHPFFRGIDWENIRSMPAPYIPPLSDKKDTSNFDSFIPAHEFDTSISATPEAKLSMNDFTYRSFWNKPRSE